MDCEPSYAAEYIWMVRIWVSGVQEGIVLPGGLFGSSVLSNRDHLSYITVQTAVSSTHATTQHSTPVRRRRTLPIASAIHLAPIWDIAQASSSPRSLPRNSASCLHCDRRAQLRATTPPTHALNAPTAHTRRQDGGHHSAKRNEHVDDTHTLLQPAPWPQCPDRLYQETQRPTHATRRCRAFV
jgi:hypothetical protein